VVIDPPVDGVVVGLVVVVVDPPVEGVVVGLVVVVIDPPVDGVVVGLVVVVVDPPVEGLLITRLHAENRAAPGAASERRKNAVVWRMVAPRGHGPAGGKESERPARRWSAGAQPPAWRDGCAQRREPPLTRR
jgi:hypothetical protein